jgi:predicted DNA-binding protein (MmcQ/YjbR family)
VPDVDWIRKLCLSFPDATENMQWGEDLCFKVHGKIFAVVDLSKGKLAPISFKCAPERFQELVEIEGIAPAPYVGRYQWVLLECAGILTSGELEDLIRQSYELVVAKAPRKKATERKQALSKRRRAK